MSSNAARPPAIIGLAIVPQAIIAQCNIFGSLYPKQKKVELVF